MSKSSIDYTIREIEEKDIESGGLLDVLENLAPVGGLTKPAREINIKRGKIKSTPQNICCRCSRGHRPRFDNRNNNAPCRAKIHFRWRTSRTHRGCSSKGWVSEERHWIQACKLRYRSSCRNAMRKNSPRLFR